MRELYASVIVGRQLEKVANGKCSATSDQSLPSRDAVGGEVERQAIRDTILGSCRWEL
jgi:hypothetical protein